MSTRPVTQRVVLLGAWMVAGGISCASEHVVMPNVPSGDPAKFAWTLPPGFPMPVVPDDNPMSDAKVELGRHLFFDVRLSANETFSCASCHRQSNAFADARNRPLGSTGEPHPRNSMGLSNVAYQPVLGWANTTTRTLEAQARIPMFGDMPVELGLKGKEGVLLQRLRDVQRYRALFAASFPGEPDPVTLGNVTRAIAAFQRTFLSGDAPYDRWRRGDASAMSESAKRGEALFMGDRLKCSSCHRGVLFTNAVRQVGGTTDDPEFFNNGLYNVGGTGQYPADNTGLHALTGVASDMGKFKVPSLRNIEVTFPYMHDGSVATLGDVLDHYAAGGRTLATGPYAGVGRDSRYKSPLVGGFTLTAQEKADVVEFLRALTDSGFLRNARFANPWLK